MSSASNRLAAWLVVVVFALGCSRDTPKDAPPAPAQPAPSKGGAPEVSLAQVLFDEGRVVVAAATKGKVLGARQIPGEAVADPAGRAEAGVLVQGRIVSLSVDIGSLVKAGDVLAWVDSPEAARVSADVVRADARLALAERKEARQKALMLEGATSQNALDEAVAEASLARAEKQAASGLLRSLGGVGGSGRVAVRSPIDGVVSKRQGIVGASTSPESALFEIVRRAPRLVVARVPEGSTVKLVNGARARVRPRATLGEVGEGCLGTVRGDVGEVDRETRTRATRVEVDEGCAWLVVGAFVRVEPADGSASSAPGLDVVLVPRDALVDVKGMTGVFVQRAPKGPVAFRPVRAKAGADERAEVEEGLAEGERVVVVGASLVKSELLRAELHE